jgi:hypothetical protein
MDKLARFPLFSLFSYTSCPAELVASMEASNSLLHRPFSLSFNKNNRHPPLLNKKPLLPVLPHRSQSPYSLLTTRTLRTKKLPQLLARQQPVSYCCQSYLLSVIIETFVPPNPKDGPRPLLLHQSSANPSHRPTNIPMFPHWPRSLRLA